jgi:hypothetical protein
VFRFEILVKDEIGASRTEPLRGWAVDARANADHTDAQSPPRCNPRWCNPRCLRSRNDDIDHISAFGHLVGEVGAQYELYRC